MARVVQYGPQRPLRSTLPTAMSNRLTQIATRTGDDGSTGLGDGTRVQK